MTIKHDTKICITRKTACLIFFIFIIITGVFIFNRTSNKKLGYYSQATLGRCGYNGYCVPSYWNCYLYGKLPRYDNDLGCDDDINEICCDDKNYPRPTRKPAPTKILPSPTPIKKLTMDDLQLGEEQKNQLELGLTYIFYKGVIPENALWIEPTNDLINFKIDDSLIFQQLLSSFNNIGDPKAINSFEVTISHLGNSYQVEHQQIFSQSNTFVGNPMIGYIHNIDDRIQTNKDLPSSLINKIVFNGFSHAGPDMPLLSCGQTKCIIFRYILDDDNYYHLQYMLIDYETSERQIKTTVETFGLNLETNELVKMKRSEQLVNYGLTLFPDENLPADIKWQTLLDKNLIKAKDISISSSLKMAKINKNSVKLLAVFVTRQKNSFSWQISIENQSENSNFIAGSNMTYPNNPIPNDGFLENGFLSTSPILICSDSQCVLLQYAQKEEDLVLRYVVFDYQE